MKLSHALRICHPASVAFVGAGGKTTAMFRLARELSETGPIVVTTTTHIGAWQIPLSDHHVVVEKLSALDRLIQDKQGKVTLVTGALDGGKVRGLSRTTAQRLHAFCSAHGLPLLVEADGAHQKPLKAPAEHEPALPQWSELVVVVAGLSAIGRPLSTALIHRPEIFGNLCQLEAGKVIQPEALIRLLAHPQGGLKNMPAHARRVALLNQVDSAKRQSYADRIAEGLQGIYHSIVIASLRQEDADRVATKACEPVAGVVLAAGASRRLGQPKQLLLWNGKPFVRVIAETALSAGLAPVIVVTGANADRIHEALSDLPVTIAFNRNWSQGQGTSIAVGMHALPEVSSPLYPGAAIFLLADQPQVTRQVCVSLVDRHQQTLAPVLAPLVEGRRANPVLFDRRTFQDLGNLSGDVGGRALFEKYPIGYIPWQDKKLLLDVDKIDDLIHLNHDEGG